MNIRLVCYYLGWTLLPFAFSMLLLFPFMAWYKEWSLAIGIAESMGISLLLGASLLAVGWEVREQEVFRREAIAVVGLTWLGVATLGSLPFYLTQMLPHFTDAFFESMSGLTTTGASILEEIEAHPKSLLFWRSWMHFIGGLGIVVIFIALMPVFPIGGKALYRSEVTGPVKEGMTPRVKDTAIRIFAVYLGLNVILSICLMIAGMSFYEAINHAMSTIATGGFSTKNASIASFNSPAIEWIIIVFMILSGTSFVLHLQGVRGRLWAYMKNTEFRVYVSMIFGAALIVAFALWGLGAEAVSAPGSFPFRDALFSVCTILTSTGFGTADFDAWPTVCKMFLFLFMFVEAMGNSTSGGIKMVRWVIIFKVFSQRLRQAVTPRRISPLKLDGKPIEEKVEEGIVIFVLFYIAIFGVSSLLLSLMMPEQPLTDSISAVLACMGNIGPGFGAVGPAANYNYLSAAAKWLLSFDMIIGRLEIFPILILFSPRFWMGR